jgi:hypothetical protein
MTRTALVSCHVEAPLDDEVWRRYSELASQRPRGFRLISLMRPPDGDEWERVDIWLERARAAALWSDLGHHTHFHSATVARPTADSPRPAQRVADEAAWMRSEGLEPHWFCGGGWYIDRAVATAVGVLGYVDVTATRFRHDYLEKGAPRASLDTPGELSLLGAPPVNEMPTTHSPRMLLRDAARPSRGSRGGSAWR